MKFLDNNISYLYPELMQLGNDPDAPLCQVPEDVCLFATAREGLSYIANSLERPTKRLLAPAYTCETVTLPFVKEGYSCAYYGMDTNLRINEEHFLGLLEYYRPDVIVVHPLYGMDLSENEQALLKKAKEQGCFIVEDLTHSLFSQKRYDFVDAYVGSLRKWFNVPDGGFYESKVLLPPSHWQELPEKKEFLELMISNLYLRGVWERGGDPNLRKIFSQLDKIAVQENRRNWDLYRISDFSRRLLCKIDIKDNNIHTKVQRSLLCAQTGTKARIEEYHHQGLVFTKIIEFETVGFNLESLFHSEVEITNIIYRCKMSHN